MGAVVLAWVMALALWQAPATMPQSRVILLPDANGKVGALLVTRVGADQAAVTLDKAFETASVSNAGALASHAATRSVSEEMAALRERFGAALSARPPAPRSFVVYFGSGPAVEFIAAAGPVLEELRQFLASHPAPEIMVIGHTDSVGSNASNDRLSYNRAFAVRDFLRGAGIVANTLEIAGRGERELAVPTADEVAEPKNRRVEILVR